MNKKEAIKEWLNHLAELYENKSFISNDPILIPHSFKKKEDIEIAAFLTAILSWGNRKSIISSAQKLMHLMDNEPHEFILRASNLQWIRFENYVYRTFNSEDCLFFLKTIQVLYKNNQTLELIFTTGYHINQTIFSAIKYFYNVFFSYNHSPRVRKHLPNVEKGSAAKRINMFLRWMVRSNKKGVDFGLWKEIPASSLMIPLDVHVTTAAKKISLLYRKSIDWKAVEELTYHLRSFDPEDPIKYDFALFAINEKKIHINA